jgi:hypothetical protein
MIPSSSLGVRSGGVSGWHVAAIPGKESILFMSTHLDQRTCGVWPLARGIWRCRFHLRLRMRRKQAAATPVGGTGGSIVSLLGRCGGLRGRCWVAVGDHRGDQGIVRHGDRRGHSRSSLRPGPLPPGHPRTHRSVKETVETINGTRSRNGEKSRRVFAACRSAWRVLHPACRGHAEHSPRPVPNGPIPGRIAPVVSH